jgi:hypothetical protein
MILDLPQSQDLCDWLLQRGLGLGECAWVLADMQSGDSFALALLKVFETRKKQMEKVHEKDPVPDWGNPIVA